MQDRCHMAGATWRDLRPTVLHTRLSAAQVTAKREARGTNRAINGTLDLVDWIVYVTMHGDYKAEDAAATTEQGDKKFLTHSRRKLNTMSKSIMPLLDAISKELWVLRGRLAIIFHVCIAVKLLHFLRLIKVLQLAQYREKVRRDILDTFEDIPGIIAMGCSKSQSFAQDAKLHDSIEDLKVTLFEAIPSLIEILMPGKFC
jgi:hypothetical protein